MLSTTQPFSLERTTAPSLEPVSVAEAKRFAKVDDSADDSLVRDLIVAAREMVEQDARVSLLTQTWTLKLDCFPRRHITLWRPPIQSVTSIQYIDNAGDTQTFSSSSYSVDIAKRPGTITLAYNQSWPTTRGIENAVTVVYVAGNTTRVGVPRRLKQAIQLLIEHWYDERNMVTVGSISKPLEFTYNALISGEAVQTYP